MSRIAAVCLLPLLLTGCLTLAGCGQANPSGTVSTGADHDHDHDHAGHDHENEHEHGGELERAFAEAAPILSGKGEGEEDHAKTFAEAVAQITALKTKVQQSLAAGDQEAADGPVHEIGHLLERTVELAGKELSAESRVEAVKQSVDQLLDAFGEIDATLHGQPGKSYEEVESTIESALRQLESQVQP